MSKKISELTAATSVSGNEIIPAVVSGGNVSVTAKQLGNYAVTLAGLGNYLTKTDAASTYAKKTDIVTVDLTPYLKSADAETKYQPKGTYLTAVPTATATVLGGVKIGANITVKDGVISVAAPYSLTKAAVEGVLTGDITSHSHSQYLTAHQVLPTTLPNPAAITVTLNGGTTEGSNKFTYTGSAAKAVNITAAAIGAAATSHTHANYATTTALSDLETKLTELTERVTALETPTEE